MHTLVLDPNGAPVTPPGWVVAPSGTHYGVLADGSIASPNDTTYVYNVFDHSVLLLAFEPATSIPDSSAIVQVWPNYRGKCTGGGRIACTLQLGSKWEAAGDRLVLPASFATIGGKARTTDPTGKRWTKSSIASLGMDIANAAVADGYLSTLELHVGYVNVPTVDSVTPSSVIGSAAPLIGWVHVHDEGFVQVGYQVKVFENATVLRGDFDPSTSPTYADSGQVYSPDDSWQLDRALVDGEGYWISVRTAVSTPIGPLWGVLTNPGTYIAPSFDAPAVPSMVVEPQPDAGRVRIELKALDNLLSTQEADLERSSDVSSWIASVANMTLGIGAGWGAHGAGPDGLGMTKTVGTGDMGANTNNGYYVNGSADAISASCQVKPGGAYPNRNGKLTLVAWGSAGILSAQDGPTVSMGGGFSTLECENFVPPAATLYVTLFVSVLGAANGELWTADAIGIYRGTAAPATFTRGGLWTRNLLDIDTSSLEAGLGSWVAANTNTTLARSSTVAKQGSYALRLTAGVANSGVAARSQQVAVLPGEQYAVLVSCRSGASSATAAASVAVEWFDGNGDVISVDSDDLANAPSSSWSDHAYGTVAPAGAATADVLVSFSGALANGTTYYADAVELERWGDGAMPTAFSLGQHSLVSTWLVVEYSDDDGTTWTPVRDADRLSPDVFQRARVFDYEVPPNVLRRYRARTESLDDYVGGVIASANTSEQFATVPSGRWWLRSIAHPERSLGFSRDLAMRNVGRKIEERSGRFDGNGAAFPVYITNAVGGQDGTLDLSVYGRDMWDAFLLLISDPDPLVLIDPIDLDLHYVKLTGRSWTEKVTGEGPRYDVRLDFDEVARP